MEQKWKQIFGAFILGVMMPMAIFRIWRVDKIQPTETKPAEETVQHLPTAVYIPLLWTDGTTRMVELENYLLGVVLAEMPAEFECEALKAQAVVARTYTLKRVADRDRHPGGGVCTDSACCQTYMSVEEYLQNVSTMENVEKVRQAIKDTEGEVLLYEGELIDATYFSCSGGRTEAAVAVWGKDVPYLQSVDSPGEEWAEPYTDTIYFPAEEFTSRLAMELPGTPESWLGWATYTQGGGIDKIWIGGMEFSGIEIRKRLGLRSTMFAMTADAGGITVQTRGKGHRVGMSQYGAEARAVSGCSYQQILAHYYLGTKLEVLTNLQNKGKIAQ